MWPGGVLVRCAYLLPVRITGGDEDMTAGCLREVALDASVVHCVVENQ
jgi:hypothetical protein